MIAAGALASLAGLVLVLCALGASALRDPLDKLHYAGPATTLAPALIALAIVVEDGVTSQAGLKAVLTALVIAATSPAVTFATLRAIRTRDAKAPVPAGEPEVQS